MATGEGLYRSKQGAVEDCHWGENRRHMISNRISCAGMADVEAIVACVVTGIRRRV